ncbi:spermidine hydroxycinnamoyl transferase [Dorcoceras hygrometricum]|uniref:Spermidine hydroxycinnamoyl transferase n=1 Tax=Dorcoceras hygrometricum TaxID=472368 RepID=A0A2Z7BDI1_9LAMI|nr:spermidine hydroxycinnamoyl transferase [Dorcoceras hygrometricum]
MKVVLNNSCLVQPAEPTWNGPMPLTEFDQTDVIAHVQTIYFYRPSETWLTQKGAIFTTLETSLSRILVHFYPLAGRLRWLDGARLVLECNGKGVQLMEAETDADLDILGDFTASPYFHHLIHPINYKAPIEEIPLVIVKLTRFKCGGIALCYSISHAVVDGQSALHLISEWANMARGDSLRDVPCLDRTLLRAGDPPIPISDQPCFEHEQFDPLPLLIGQDNFENERKKETTAAMLKLTKIQVEMLKNEANRTRPFNDGDRVFTRYEAIAAHIWRCACRARGHIYEQPTSASLCLDVRNRVQPALPRKYFGNAIVDVAATGCSGDIVTRPLGYAASRIREAINMVSSEFVHNTLDYLKNLQDLSTLQDIHGMKTNQGPFYGNPNLGIISWLSLPLYGLDFGWGKEIFMGPGTYVCDGDIIILPGHDEDGSLIVSLCLQAGYIEDFKNFFYEDIGKLGISSMLEKSNGEK